MNLAEMITQAACCVDNSHAVRAYNARGVFIESARKARHELFRPVMKGKGVIVANTIAPLINRSNSNTHRSLRLLIDEGKVRKSKKGYEWLGD